jgi:hypothetical protein
MNDLYKALRICLGKDTKLIQKSEWIDFNSKYFYPILGILLGIGAIFLLDYMINSDIPSIRVVISSFLVFVTGLGLQFICLN